jgi:16S rRNA (guanine966-N2)-methyltransferase
MALVMRIVAGQLGGRVLRAPRGDTTRPTSERVREALFSILGPPRSGDMVLDLFAGAGGLGLEALSRGAAHVTFVDLSRTAIEALRHNVAAMGVSARAEIFSGDAVRLVPSLRPGPPKPSAANNPQPSPGSSSWRWIFIDPPYRSDLAVRAASAIPRCTLSDQTDVLIEHDRRTPPPDRIESLVRTDVRRYGDTLISFYRARPEPP